MTNRLNYIGSERQIIEALKFEVNDLIIQIKEYRVPNYVRERLITSQEILKDCDDPQELNEWIGDLRSELNFYETKELEEMIAYNNFPQDDYGEGYYQKV